MHFVQNLFSIKLFLFMKHTVKFVCMEGKQTSTRFWWGNRKERDRLKDLGIGGKIILKLILNK
jgi:hypothetical protein